MLHKVFSTVTFSLIIAASAWSVRADDVNEVEQAAGPVTFSPLSKGSPGRPSTINGEKIPLSVFPSTFYNKVNDKLFCTTTLVGRRVVLTAAHCVPDKGQISLALSPTVTISGDCNHHAAYRLARGDPSADYALCRLAKEVHRGAIEVLFIDAPAMQSPADVLLMGFGCTRVDQTGGVNGELTGGMAKVALSVGSVRLAIGGTERDMPNYFSTKSEPTGVGAIVCPADSGGAAYQVRKKNGKYDYGGERRILAVNSRFGKTAEGLADGRSFLSSTSTASFKGFVVDWLHDHPDSKICGVNESAHNCRR